VDDIIFVDGYLSTVLGVRLLSGRSVVVKVRRYADRLEGCTEVHRRLWERGFPCPRPIVGLETLGDFVASAEELVEGGHLLPSRGRSGVAFAQALARLVEMAPPDGEVPSLDPPPPWTHPGPNASSPLWPDPDDRDADLNSVDGPRWIDEAGRAARARLRASGAPVVIGHGDWYTGNLRWMGDNLLTVWDWDSAIALPEAVVAGLAAAVYPANGAGTEATVEESEDFLAAYEEARGSAFSDDDRQVAWAAGLWNRSFDAKKQFATDREPKSLTESEAIERRIQAGIDPDLAV
jgi:hypothetical protein